GGTSYGSLLVFIDRGAAGDPFEAHLRTCLRDPVTAGFRITRMTLTLNGVFANPSSPGDYRWTAIGRTASALPSPPVESQTVVRLPPKLTIAVKVIRPHGRHGRAFVRVSGAVTEHGR